MSWYANMIDEEKKRIKQLKYERFILLVLIILLIGLYFLIMVFGR